ncbi:MAG TPA: GNAT family N-acetyltransferase [Vicinamibacterales bacterium]
MAIQMMTGRAHNTGIHSSEPPMAPASWERVDGAVSTDWKQGLPMLAGKGLHLRELRISDAASLCALLTTEEVARFISPPPTTVEGFVKFIEWTHRRRAEGKHVCFAVVPDGSDSAVGIIQFHTLSGDFSVGEWGFALGSAYWGSGLFAAAARLVLDFAFDTVGVKRLEARAVTENGRGNGALKKMGAVREARLRQSFAKGLTQYDQYLWSILSADWQRAKATWTEGALTVH